VGEVGSLLFTVQLDDAKAESLRSSPSASTCVFLRAEALGPGLVRGRRTLGSHPRDTGPLSEGFAAFEGGAHWEGSCGALGSEVVAVRALPERSAAAASSLMATRGAASSHEAAPEMMAAPRNERARRGGYLRLRRASNGRTKQTSWACEWGSSSSCSQVERLERKNIEMQRTSKTLNMGNCKGALRFPREQFALADNLRTCSSVLCNA